MTAPLGDGTEQEAATTCGWNGCTALWPPVPTNGWASIYVVLILDADVRAHVAADSRFFLCPEHTKAFVALTKVPLPEMVVTG